MTGIIWHWPWNKSKYKSLHFLLANLKRLNLCCFYRWFRWLIAVSFFSGNEIKEVWLASGWIWIFWKLHHNGHIVPEFVFTGFSTTEVIIEMIAKLFYLRQGWFSQNPDLKCLNFYSCFNLSTYDGLASWRRQTKNKWFISKTTLNFLFTLNDL